MSTLKIECLFFNLYTALIMIYSGRGCAEFPTQIFYNSTQSDLAFSRWISILLEFGACCGCFLLQLYLRFEELRCTELS